VAADAKAADAAWTKSAAAAHAAAIFNVVTFPGIVQAHRVVPHWPTEVAGAAEGPPVTWMSATMSFCQVGWS
jgi:hypothetical protein